MIDGTDVRVWWSDFRERWSRRVICPLIGHKWDQKMRGQICTRCRTWTAVDGEAPVTA